MALLAHFPDASESYGTTVLEWQPIQELQDLDIHELRIDETIAGMNNLSAIFYKASSLMGDEDRCRIWILSVVAKNDQEFDKHLLSIFAELRDLIVFRYYGST